MNCDYPGKWKGEIERIEKAGETIILAGNVVSADDGEPPKWRRGF